MLKVGQDLILEKKQDESTIFNMDETAYTWAIGPTHLYVPKKQQRASNLGIANTKLRITAVITVGANGDFAPLMIIVKHSVSSLARPDQSGMRVIKDLHKKPEFGNTNGCGRTGYTGPTGRTGPSPDPSDPTAYCTHTSLEQLLASSSLLVEVILASSLDFVTN